MSSKRQLLAAFLQGKISAGEFRREICLLNGPPLIGIEFEGEGAVTWKEDGKDVTGSREDFYRAGRRKITFLMAITGGRCAPVTSEADITDDI